MDPKTQNSFLLNIYQTCQLKKLPKKKLKIIIGSCQDSARCYLKRVNLHNLYIQEIVLVASFLLSWIIKSKYDLSEMCSYYYASNVPRYRPLIEFKIKADYGTRWLASSCFYHEMQPKLRKFLYFGCHFVKKNNLKFSTLTLS